MKKLPVIGATVLFALVSLGQTASQKTENSGAGAVAESRGQEVQQAPSLGEVARSSRKAAEVKTFDCTADESKKETRSIVLMKREAPSYPAEAKAKHVSGAVLLRVAVDGQGRFERAEVESGPPELTEAAVSAVKHWQFCPALRSGRAIASSVEVEVSFSLEHGQKSF